jgi:hypothetical protein
VTKSVKANNYPRNAPDLQAGAWKSQKECHPAMVFFATAPRNLEPLDGQVGKTVDAAPSFDCWFLPDDELGNYSERCRERQPKLSVGGRNTCADFWNDILSPQF